MKKRKLITYSAVLLASALIIGCSTADRTVEEIIDGGDGKINNGPIAQTPGDTITDDIPINGSIGQDNNDTTTGVIQIDVKNAYKVSVKFSNDYNEKGYYSRGEVGRLFFDITNLYTGASADISIINEIVLSAEDTFEGSNESKYFDFIKFTGEQGSIYIIDKESVKASDSVAIKMKDLSGTTNIIFKATIKLAGSEESSEYEIKIPLVIEKNKSSSMSIVRIGSEYESDKGLFVDTFAIHVVDSYGNRAQDGTSISTGVINNTKLYSNAYDTAISDYRDDKANLSNDYFIPSITSYAIDKNVLTNEDTLVILANQNQHKPENLGGWDIKEVNDNNLSLINLDKNINANGVSYVIGNEYRYLNYGNTIINAAASTFESTSVVDGLAFAKLRYPSEMAGKNVFIYANSRLDNKHIGISRKILLHGTGIESRTLSCTNDKGDYPNCSGSFFMKLNDSGRGAHKTGVTVQTVGQSFGIPSISDTTSESGWTTVTINNIEVNKTATVEFGSFIKNETIKNQ